MTTSDSRVKQTPRSFSPHNRPSTGIVKLTRISQCAFSARTPCGRKEPTYVVVGKQGS